LDNLDHATSFEQWEELAFKIDQLLGYDIWRQNPTSKVYDYRLLYERLRAIIEAREEEDVFGLIGILRSGLVRNLGNITTPKLFNRAYAGTKLLIEDYITQVALAVEYITALPTDQGFHPSWNSQAKLDLLHDTRQAFGRSTLVLHGGAIFGLSHLGVVKALHLRGLLPRIITGTATGALIAALVCIHTEEELLDFLNGDGIDLTAFARQPGEAPMSSVAHSLLPKDSHSSYATLLRRIRRYFREGYFLDVNVLGTCVRANVGDLTFEEAYARTKRVLNITIAPSSRSGVPTLLNYLTAPNVLIWSAALVSNTSSTALYAPVTLLCKNPSAGGRIEPWSVADGIEMRPAQEAPRAHPTIVGDRATPLHRIAELFNVNHFIVSQARPYVAPFLRSELHHPNARGVMSSAGWLGGLLAAVVRLLVLEVHHRLAQLDSLGLVPTSVRRLLLDETIPGASITLVPDITAADLGKLLSLPTRESLDYWILRGERAVWPAVGSLRIRCAVEVELDRGYQVVRRRKPLDGETSSIRKVGSRGSSRRARANSTGQH
jgi:TAG lipase / lysophosphatidylethanolamine acyltransferase